MLSKSYFVGKFHILHLPSLFHPSKFVDLRLHWLASKRLMRLISRE